MKIEYEIPESNKQEEKQGENKFASRTLLDIYEDMVSIHKKLVEEYGKDIAIHLRTDRFTLKLEDDNVYHEVCISGDVSKHIQFKNQNLPKLEEFLIEPVEEIEIRCGRWSSKKNLDITIRKKENPPSYKVEGYIDNPDDFKFLEYVNDLIRKNIITKKN